MKKFFTIAIIAFTINAFAQNLSNVDLNNGISIREIKRLTVNPLAQPDLICRGQAVNLLSVPDGGSTNYSFSWSSNPPGFISDDANPVVTPDVTTVYTVQVSDGENITTGNVTVTVKQSPIVNLIPLDDPDILILSATEISTCVFDTINLDAGNPGCIYHWNTGDDVQKLNILSSGISVDLQRYNVTVTNPITGCSNDAEITINFTFTECTYGLDEKENLGLSVYPNPASDIFNIIVTNPGNELTLEVFSSIGTLVYRNIVNGINGSSFKSALDLSNQPSGVYFLKIKGARVNRSQKIIIN